MTRRASSRTVGAPGGREPTRGKRGPALEASTVSGNGAAALFKGLVPRYVSPAVLDHLRRSGAKFETGPADYHRHVLEVYTTFDGAEVLERHGVATRLVKRGASWPEERLPKAAGRAAYLVARSVAADDPLEVAFRAYDADMRASRKEPVT